MPKPSTTCTTNPHGRCVSDSCPIRADWLLTVRATDGILIDVSGTRPWPCATGPLAPGDRTPVPIPQVGTPYTWPLAFTCTQVPTLLVACAHSILLPSGAGQELGKLVSVRVADASACNPTVGRCLDTNRILLRVSAAGIIDVALVSRPGFPSIIPALFGKHVLALVASHPADAARLLRALARAEASGGVEQVVVHGSVAGKVDLGHVRVSVRAMDGGKMAVSVAPAVVGRGQDGVWQREMREAGVVVASEDMFPEDEDGWVVGARDGEYVAVEDECPVAFSQWRIPLALYSSYSSCSWLPSLSHTRRQPIPSHIHGQLGQVIDLISGVCAEIRGYIAEYAAYLVECAGEMVREVSVAVQSASSGWVGGLVLAAVVG